MVERGGSGIKPEAAVYLFSLGCDKNKVDGEVMRGRLLDAGCEITDDPAEADVIVVNTCGFIKEAVQESIDLILEMAAYKQIGRCRRLVVVGCMTERYREEMGEELPEVDAVLGVADRDGIVSAVLAGESGDCFGAAKGTGGDSASGGAAGGTLRYRLLARKGADLPHIAYVKIAEGCDNRCTYCTIPAIRGRYTSRPPAEILEECAALIADGVREIVLVAQDTARYGVDLPDKPTLAALLRAIDNLCAAANKKTGAVVWVRLLYAYPEHITPELIRALAELPGVCKYLDMPIQHSEDTVLERMGRKGSRAALEALVARLRAEVPGIALRTTLMVGFPGETAKEFNGLLRFVKEMRFERLGVFPYSREENTPAADMPRQVSEKTKQSRRDRLMETQQEIHRAAQQAKIGWPLAVMADGADPNGDDPRRYIGRTQADAPEVDAAVYFSHEPGLRSGEVVTVVPTEADEYDLYA